MIFFDILRRKLKKKFYKKCHTESEIVKLYKDVSIHIFIFIDNFFTRIYAYKTKKSSINEIIIIASASIVKSYNAITCDTVQRENSLHASIQLRRL